MRLFTVQNKKALKVLEKGIWYSTIEYRIKVPDYKYVDEEDGRCPIYTFASCGIPNLSYFGLPWLYKSFNHFVGYMRFELEDSVLIELEVPEDFILNMKLVPNPYSVKCEENDPDMCYSKYDRNSKEYIYFKSDLESKPFFTSNYLENIRKYPEHEFEAVIPYISLEHVVAVRKFKSKDWGYSTTWCKEIYVSSVHTPLWTGTVGLNGNGYPVFNETTDAKILETIAEYKANNYTVFEEFIAMEFYGAKEAPEYLTVLEALDCLSLHPSYYLRSCANLLGIKDYSKAEVGEVLRKFPNKSIDYKNNCLVISNHSESVSVPVPTTDFVSFIYNIRNLQNTTDTKFLLCETNNVSITGSLSSEYPGTLTLNINRDAGKVDTIVTVVNLKDY